MGYWWDGEEQERFWVEMRKVPGIGTELLCPFYNKAGHKSGAYELVDEVRPGDVIFHWHATQAHFVGRSTASSDRIIRDDERVVPLEGFSPLVGIVDLAAVREKTATINALHDRLQAAHSGQTLYLPFQFRSDGLRMVSYYFAKMPKDLVEILFGADGWAQASAMAPPDEDGPAIDRPGGKVQRQFLQPFKAKADKDYVQRIEGGSYQRGRKHETLVNDFSEWLAAHDLIPACNQAIDIGLEVPAVIVEAKTVRRWNSAVRGAVGQLYEYKYFQVVSPESHLVFLADMPVPDLWVDYLEKDRGIAVVWRDGKDFFLTERAREAFGL